MPETPRESRGVKGLGRGIGVCSPPPHISGTEPVQDHNAIARAQHSTPRKCNCLWTAARNAYVSHGATGS